MNVDLGNADAGVALSLDVINDFLNRLRRIGRLPDRVEFDREFGGQIFNVVVLIDNLHFEMITTGPDSPRTVLRLSGNIEARPANDPGAVPLVFPLDALVRLTIILVPGTGVPDVGFRYDGVEQAPAPPVTEADIDAFMTGPDIQGVLNQTRLAIAANLVAGLNASRFPIQAIRPADADWSVGLTLTPAGVDTVDAFVVSAAPPGVGANLGITESFVLPRTGLGVAYSRSFLNLMLERGAAAQESQTVGGAEITSLTMKMADSGIEIHGHVVRKIDTPLIDIAPDVDIDFDGIAIPQLIRGTTAMTMDTSGIVVDVDDTDEIFYGALQWVLTIGASALLFTGVGSLTAIGIGLWLTAVQSAWNGAVELDNAPNVLRESLAASLGAQLGVLADSLDDSTPAGDLAVQGTPDSMAVSNGNFVFFAQVIIAALDTRMRSAEYSSKLRRFAIFELADLRRFRAQELARLMKLGVVKVSGFHDVDGDFVRSDHDNVASNNLLETYKSNETREVVVANV